MGLIDYILLSILGICIVLVIIYLLKNKDKCSSGCSSCPLSNKCHKKKINK